MENGAHILPEDACKAVRFITEGGTRSTEAFWNRQQRKGKDRPRALPSDLRRLRNRVAPVRSETRVRLHAPLLEDPMEQNEAGRADGCGQFALGLPMLGELGEPGVYPPSSELSGSLLGEELLKSDSSRFVSARKGQGPKVEELRREAISQT